jgi:hypothetical protein
MAKGILNLKNALSSLLLIALISTVNISCSKRDYPCPGLGKSNEADMSMFDENGKLKEGKGSGRMDRGTGLVKKKKPKKLNAKRRTHV